LRFFAHTRPARLAQNDGGGTRVVLVAMLLLVLTTACRQKMANQPRYDPLEASDFFADGMSARPRVPNTVARGELSTNPFFDTGKIDGAEADGFPFAVTLGTINRGEERFNIYCSECHGRVGDGHGMIPARGYRRPPSFHTAALRNARTGHFFDVMTNGFGSMPPYGTMIPPEDRWAIVAYIRALQLSQNATVNDVPPADRARLDAPASTAVPHSALSTQDSGLHGGTH
jgi:mono/diheme cytochrome c family protein